MSIRSARGVLQTSGENVYCGDIIKNSMIYRKLPGDHRGGAGAPRNLGASGWSHHRGPPQWRPNKELGSV